MAWARAWNDEALEDGGEGEVTGTTGQEWELRWDLAEDLAVEAVLLTLLADDRADATDETIVAGVSEDSLDIWESAEDDVGEGRGERDSINKVIDWEDVCARLDGLAREVVEGAVGIQLMELLLSEDDFECAENEVTVGWDIRRGVSWLVQGDVLDELGKERDLEELVERDESKRHFAIAMDARWWGAVWKSTTGFFLDLVELSRWVFNIWEAVSEREVEALLAAASRSGISGRSDY